MILQTAVATIQNHPLSGTAAEWMWLLPILPLLGFVINGLLSLNSAHFGPKDPNTPAHHPHSEAAAEAPAASTTASIARAAGPAGEYRAGASAC